MVGRRRSMSHIVTSRQTSEFDGLGWVTLPGCVASHRRMDRTTQTTEREMGHSTWSLLSRFFKTSLPSVGVSTPASLSQVAARSPQAGPGQFLSVVFVCTSNVDIFSVQRLFLIESAFVILTKIVVELVGEITCRLI